MTHSDRPPKGIAQLALHLLFPQSGTTAITATRICQDHQLGGLGIGMAPMLIPPTPTGLDGKFRRIRRLAQIDNPFITLHIVDTISTTRPSASERTSCTFLGLIPSEYSSGEQRRQGSITKAGHSHARRALGEGAWAYRYAAKVSRHVQLRLEKHPKIIQDISGTAPVRLCKRYRRLVSRGQHVHVVTVAIARELAGFMGAIAKQVPITP